MFIVAATLLVAYANGANDNFKGVATLFGSGTTAYRTALGWGTITTLAGPWRPSFSKILGINSPKLLDASHFLSAGAVSFARGLNDTPKIVALGLVASALDLRVSILLVAVTMMFGGLLNTSAVAQTVSKKITGMEPEHGLWANVVTSVLVIFASKWGMPVSTTHVSCGALFGIGIANGRAQSHVIRAILLAWLLTFPMAALFSAGVYLLVRQL